mgnify:CR=1 FL=1
MEVEEKTEEKIKKAGRPPTTNKKRSEKKAKKEDFDPTLFGCNSKRALIDSVVEDLREFISLPECSVYRFGITVGHEKISIYSRTEVYVCSIIYFQSPNRDHHMVTHDPTFLREVTLLGSDKLKEFIKTISI